MLVTRSSPERLYVVVTACGTDRSVSMQSSLGNVRPGVLLEAELSVFIYCTVRHDLKLLS